MVQPRQRAGQSAKRGELTGPNPTDRAKKGVKRHVLTDARGVPLAVPITGANTASPTPKRAPDASSRTSAAVVNRHCLAAFEASRVAGSSSEPTAGTIACGGLLVRWERKSCNYLALLMLACALIALQQA
jgi:hypothetical protein